MLADSFGGRDRVRYNIMLLACMVLPVAPDLSIPTKIDVGCGRKIYPGAAPTAKSFYPGLYLLGFGIRAPTEPVNPDLPFVLRVINQLKDFHRFGPAYPTWSSLPSFTSRPGYPSLMVPSETLSGEIR